LVWTRIGRGCCPNQHARGGCPDRSNAWGRVSWAKADVPVEDLTISGTSTGIQASSCLFDFSLLSLLFMLMYTVLVTFSDCHYVHTCMAKVMRNLYRKYCRVWCSFRSFRTGGTKAVNPRLFLQGEEHEALMAGGSSKQCQERSPGAF
jgi:hypothetical protein